MFEPESFFASLNLSILIGELFSFNMCALLYVGPIASTASVQAKGPHFLNSILAHPFTAEHHPTASSLLGTRRTSCNGGRVVSRHNSSSELRLSHGQNASM